MKLVLSPRTRAAALVAAVSLLVGPVVATPAVAAPPVTASVASAPVASAPVAAALKSAKPKISGKAQVGKKLTAKPGKWTSGTKLTYTWKVGGKKVATGKTFTPKKAHVGKNVKVTVTGKKSGQKTVNRTSGTKKVAKGQFSAAKPKVSGKVVGGTTLKVSRGTWSPKPAKVTYQWKANGKAIKGATKSSFTPKAAQAGKKITVTVTGTRPGYAKKSRTSAATGTVLIKPRVTTQPTGVIVDAGKNVRMSVAASGGGLSYQWQRRSVGDTSWKNMSGKTSKTLSFTSKAADTLTEYRVVVKNKAGKVNSQAAMLLVDSTPARPYPADTIYIGDYWMQAVSKTQVERFDSRESYVYATLVACPLSDDIYYSPYWDLFSEYRAGGTWYWGEEYDMGVDRDGCGIVMIGSYVPTSGAKGGIWGITDVSAGRWTTQYIDGLK